MLSVLRPHAGPLRASRAFVQCARTLATSAPARTPEDEIARVMDLAREKAIGRPRPRSGGDSLRMLMFGKPGAGKVSGPAWAAHLPAPRRLARCPALA